MKNKKLIITITAITGLCVLSFAYYKLVYKGLGFDKMKNKNKKEIIIENNKLK